MFAYSLSAHFLMPCSNHVLLDFHFPFRYHDFIRVLVHLASASVGRPLWEMCNSKMAYFKYQMTADRLIELISDGTYVAKQRIPSEEELCGQLGVGRQTLRKAVELLEEAGYLKRVQGSGTYVLDRKDRIMQGVSSPRNSGSIALIMMNCESYIFLDVMRGISDYLIGTGYALTTIITGSDYEKERMALKSLMDNPPDGILFEPVCSGILSVNDALYREVAEKIPCLLMHMDATTQFPAIPLHDREGTKRMTDYLISLGHKRIGTLFVFDETTGQNRYRGFLESLRDNGIAHKSDDSVWMEHNKKNDVFEKAGCLALERMLQSVTAVLCHDDRVAYSLIQYLNGKGMRVPEDISVTGYDDSDFSTLDLPLTTVAHPKAEYGRRAAQALLDLIHSPGDVRAEDYAIAPELIIRKSTAPPLAAREDCMKK